jgi:hypothetical protein
MLRRHTILALVLFAAPFLSPAFADDIDNLVRCQKKIASEGARFAEKTINATLKCTIEISKCQINCDQGIYGPSCETSGPPCCDSDDPSSNPLFQSCMDDAQAVCAQQTTKIAQYESTKQIRITAGCIALSTDQLCGASANGLNFAALNAGCLALNPGYVCNLQNLINCVGGPLEQSLLDQISATLAPTAPDAVAALNLEAFFPDLPVTRKAKEDLPPGKVDVWSISGQAGDEIVVRVKTRDDTPTPDNTSTLQPDLLLFRPPDLSTAVADTNVKSVPCAVPNTCGASCPLLKRRLPFNGTFAIAVRSVTANGCGGGQYRLLVTSPNGTMPTLIADDVDP